MQQRKVTYRMYPSKTQKILLGHMLGVHQKLYNKALEQRIHVYQEEKRSVSFYNQCQSLTLWREGDTELAAVNAQSEQVTLKRLDLAFQGFFRRVKNGETPGFPRFKSYHRFSGWGYKTHGDGWRFIFGKGTKHGRVKLSGVGTLPLRGQPRTPGIPKTAEVMHKAERWYLSVTMNCEPKRTAGVKAIGLDWGVETFATLVTSDNATQRIENPRLGTAWAPKIKRCHQAISRTQKGSKNRRKSIQRLGSHYRKLSQQRSNFIHQKSSELVKHSILIATETLDIQSMTAKGGAYKKGLNREILNTTPGAFFNLLKCKAEEAGIDWVEVPTRLVKPSQTCHRCGIQLKKPLSERLHHCSCGVRCSRDENSARVMLNWALLGSPTGQELSEAWSRRCLPALKHETPSVNPRSEFQRG